MKRKLQGIIVPLLTALETPETFDRKGCAGLIEHVISGGVDGIFILGSTGEGPALSRSVQRELIELAVEQVAGRVPLLAGISGASGADSLELGKFAANSGVDALVAASPCYLPPDQEEQVEYFRRLAGECGSPLFLYNMPPLTRVMLTPETVIRLASVENIVGCKDSSGDLTFFGTLVRELGSRDDFTLLTGPEELLAESVRMGGDGGVNGGANLCPELFASLYRALRDSDSEQVRRLQAEVLELGKLYRSRPGAAGVIRGLKYELSRRGLLKNVLAFPALPLRG